MHTLKFMFFIGLFLLCELVNTAELNKKIDKISRIYQVKLVGDDNLPRLNCSVDTLDLGETDMVVEVLANVKAFRVSDGRSQIDSTPEDVQSSEDPELANKIKDSLKASSNKLESEPSFLPYYEFDKDSLIKHAKRSTLIFEAWPNDNDTKTKGYFYKINYKIWKWESSSKAYLANFTLKVLCYWDVANQPIAEIYTDDDGKYNGDLLNNIDFLPKTPETSINSFLIILEKKDKSKVLQ